MEGDGKTASDSQEFPLCCSVQLVAMITRGGYDHKSLLSHWSIYSPADQGALAFFPGPRFWQPFFKTCINIFLVFLSTLQCCQRVKKTKPLLHFTNYLGKSH